MNDRYLKQEMCTFIGEQGQQLIRKKHVLIVGASALGSTSAELLVRSGIGTLTIIDRDYVEWSNLHRQQLYSEADCIDAMPKAVAAKRRLVEINSEVEIHAVALDATAENLRAYIGDDATFPYLQYDAQTKIAVLCGRNTVQIRANQLIHLDTLEMRT